MPSEMPGARRCRKPLLKNAPNIPGVGVLVAVAIVVKVITMVRDNGARVLVVQVAAVPAVEMDMVGGTDKKPGRKAANFL